MIKKALVVFLILFGTYSLFLLYFAKNWDSSQYQFQKNVINSDRYIYGKNAPKYVIIGSSLSDRIVTDSISNVYNLAMPGLSLFDGYNILTKRKLLPNTVYIETNYLNREESIDFAEIFNSRINSFFKKYFLSLRDENQPTGLIRPLLRELKHQKKGLETNLSVAPDVFNELLTNQKKLYDRPNIALIDKSIIKLKNIVQMLQKQKTRICFFEAPINPTLERTPTLNIIREKVLKNFPKVEFIPPPKGVYHTTDGVHLGGEEAMEYTRYFRNKIYCPAPN